MWCFVRFDGGCTWFDDLCHYHRAARPQKCPVLFPDVEWQPYVMPVKSNLPLMVNLAGMIPLIFAQTILSLQDHGSILY
jgi:hypothetical protein